MVELLVMRHAKSAWDTGHADFDRPLSPRGERAAARMARWIDDNELVPDRVVSSAAERTRHTALAVVGHCGIDPRSVEYLDELYHAELGVWLEVLRDQLVDRVLIVGHNPGLDDLVEYLAAETPARTSSGKLMTTAAIAHLDFDTVWTEVGFAGGHLLSLVRPRGL